MLVPVDEVKAKLTHKEIVEGMRKLRKRVKPGKMTVVKWWKRDDGFDWLDPFPQLRIPSTISLCVSFAFTSSTRNQHRRGTRAG